MQFASFLTISAIKRISAGLLAIWLSGAVFLLCCGSIKGQETEIDSCPLAKLGHCSRIVVNEDIFRIETPENDCAGVDCCAFLPQLFQKVRKSETSQNLAELPAKLKVKAVFIAFSQDKQNSLINYRPRLFNRGDTYLKNRVFRI